MAKCYQAYTHKDLDGAVSLLTLLWALPNDVITYKGFNNLQIEEMKTSIRCVSNPCPVYIMDMALREDFLPELDSDNITIIDHHSSSIPFISRFNKTTIKHKDTTSNSLLMAQLFKGKEYPERTLEQKMLIALADDFDCYRLQIPESYDLNILFWNFYKNNFDKFIQDFKEGFKGFSSNQKKLIQYVKNISEEEAVSLPIYEGNILFGNKQKRVIAAMAEKTSNNVMDILIKKYTPDIFFFINIKSQKVCIRQLNNSDPINVGQFAEKICEGGGHNNAAGGIITPLFMEVTKNLKQIS